MRYHEMRIRAGLRKAPIVTFAIALVFAVAGCMTPRHGDLRKTGVFDQRMFCAPPEYLTISQMTACHLPYGRYKTYNLPHERYCQWFVNMFARLDYVASTGQDEAEDESSPPFMLEGVNAEQIEAHLRKVQGGHTLRLFNTSHDETLTVALHLDDYPVRTALLNPVNGKALVLRHEEDGSCRIAFAPGQTWVVCFGEFARPFIFDGLYAVPWPRKEIAKLDGVWRGERLGPNVLPLSPEPPIPDGSGGYRSHYEVTIKDAPAVCELAGEQPSITMNGQPVALSTNLCVPRWDSYPRYTADITALLTTGKNEFDLAFYGGRLCLAGDFAVDRTHASVVKEKITFALGDLVRQGYPFYAGTFALETTVDLPHLARGARHLLTFPDFGAVVLHVTVNGVTFEPVVAPPWETDISAALHPGLNAVRVELTNGTDNQEAGFQRSRKKLKPFGLLAPPVIVTCEKN